MEVQQKTDLDEDKWSVVCAGLGATRHKLNVLTIRFIRLEFIITTYFHITRPEELSSRRTEYQLTFDGDL